MSLHSSHHPERSIEAVVKLREIRNQEARGRLLETRRKVISVEEEIRRVERRKDAVIRRGGAHILRERMLLDALTRIAIGHRRSLALLTEEISVLGRDYVHARGRLQAARDVETRRRRRREALDERRADEARGDTASERAIREAMEDPCEESGD